MDKPSKKLFDLLPEAKSNYTKMQDYFMSEHYPNVKRETEHFLHSLEVDGKEDAILARIEKLKTDVISSDLLRGYRVELPHGVLETLADLSETLEWEACREYREREYRSAAFADLFVPNDQLCVEKLALHIYQQNQTLQLVASFMLFFRYIEEGKLLSAHLSPEKREKRFEPDAMLVEPEPTAEPEPRWEPTLPNEFAPQLRNSRKATERFMEVFEAQILPCIVKGKHNPWNWAHVRLAFVKLEFIDEKLGHTDFGRVINQLTDVWEPGAVKGQCDRKREVEVNSDQSFVDEIVGYFEPVKEMCKA